jgi:hypothetical protein
VDLIFATRLAECNPSEAIGKAAAHDDTVCGGA